MLGDFVFLKRSSITRLTNEAKSSLSERDKKQDKILLSPITTIPPTQPISPPTSTSTTTTVTTTTVLSNNNNKSGTNKPQFDISSSSDSDNDKQSKTIEAVEAKQQQPVNAEAEPNSQKEVILKKDLKKIDFFNQNFFIFKNDDHFDKENLNRNSNNIYLLNNGTSNNNSISATASQNSNANSINGSQESLNNKQMLNAKTNNVNRVNLISSIY